MKQRYLWMLLLAVVLLLTVCGCDLPMEEQTTAATSDTAEPTESAVEPTESVAEAAESIAEPTESIAKPTESVAEPTESVTEPTESVAEPTESVAEPTESVAEPTESAVEPTESVTEPTESVTEPTESVTEPTESVAEPTESTDTPGEEAEPIQYAFLADLSRAEIDHNVFTERETLLELIEQAPKWSLNRLPELKNSASYLTEFGKGIYNLTNADVWFLSLEWKEKGINGIYQLDDTHVYTVKKFYNEDGSFLKCVYNVYEWNEDWKCWVNSTEAYIAARELSYRDFADVKVGDPQERIVEIEPALQLRFEDRFFCYSPCALLLTDGVLVIDINLADNVVHSLSFYPYGEPAEHNGFSLAMVMAEEIPPLPTWE